MHDNDQFSFLPHFGKVFVILNAKPASSCSAGWSFSVLRRLKAYFRNIMGQDRLSHLALLCIGRVYGNGRHQFAPRKGRFKYFFKLNFLNLVKKVD